jgi:Predicted membrane protein (DUF2232)
MMQIFLIGIGAGAATALLFASVVAGSPLAVLLACLAPLPILIAALGWSHWAALIAAVTASTALAVLLSPSIFIVFLIATGLPAWWLGYLALLARPADGAPEGLQWYPAGHLVVWAAILGALVVTAGILSIAAEEESFRTALRNYIERMMRIAERLGADLQNQRLQQPVDSGRLVDFFVAVLPPGMAVSATITNLLNLWLAARIVRISGRLRRPPPDLEAMRFPAYTPTLIAVAVAASFVSGLIGTIGTVFACSLLLAYAILGLAVMHAITRGMASRPFALGGLYAALLLFIWQVWPALLLSLLGLADTAFNIRSRVAGRRGSTPPNHPKI